MEEHRKLELAAAQRNASPPPVRIIRPLNDPIPPVEPKIPVEEVFRKMNALANESNGTEFREHLGPLHSVPPPDPVVAQKMEPFYGRVAWMEAEPQFEKKYPWQYSYKSYTSVVAEMVRPNNSSEFVQFFFELGNSEWLYLIAESPFYRSATRVEFRPDKGNALEILRLHLGRDMVAPVAGETDRFDVFGKAQEPSEAVRDAKSNLDKLTQSLEKAGLSASLKTIHEPELPTKPAIMETANAETQGR